MYPFFRRTLITTLSLSVIATAPFSNAARADLGPIETGDLTLDEILHASSSKRLPVKSARVIVDNDAAFQAKLEAIRAAKTSIRMVYYIYSDDYSSSVLTEELIAAAKRGVSVKLLLDYHTNYKHLDLLLAMMNEGNSGRGKMDIRFFNRPTIEIKKDVKFLTSACAPETSAKGMTACSDEKLANVEKYFAKDPNGSKSLFLKLFLSGLYSKNPAALKLAAVEGSGFNPAATGGAQPSEDEMEQLKEFGKLVFDAKFRGSLEAKIKLSLAFAMYGDKLGPIYNMLSSTLPVERERNEAAKKDWKHLTDFTHHKLLAIDDTFIQLGGRNIEDSYHMQPNALTKKYIFMDTDMAVKMSKKNTDIAKAYDRLFEFKAMTATLAQVQTELPNDLVKNIPAVAQAAAACAPVKASQFPRYEQCIEDGLKAQVLSTTAQRQDEALKTIRQNAAIYRSQYQQKAVNSWKSLLADGDSLSKSDVGSMVLTYIENIPYNKSVATGSESRVYGSSQGNDEKNGKYIHSLLVQGLRNTCKISTETGVKKRVILHQGYVLFPSNMMMALGSMFNGTWNCRNVDILVLTNSPKTTDLNVVNFFARHQLKALSDIASQSSSPAKARIKIMEYKVPENGEATRSLHSKVNVLGDDVIIGSANADVRSYFMDTNNGFFFRGAKDFVQQYQNFVGRIANDPSRVSDLMSDLLSRSQNSLLQEDITSIKEMIAKYNGSGFITPEREKIIVTELTRLLNYVYETNKALLNIEFVPRDVSQPEGGTPGHNTARELKQIEMANKFNSIMMLL